MAASDRSVCATPPESRPARRGDNLHRMLIAELTGAGCFRPTTARTVAYGAFILAVYAVAYATLLTGPGAAVRALALGALAFISVHAGFIAHEAGHGAVTRDRRVIKLLGQVFDTLLTALCYSYFCHIHRLHHPHCNERGRDPDMQSAAFSMYEQSARSKTGLGRLISRHQAALIWVLVWLQGFTLKIDSLKFLRRNLRATRVDQFVVLLHFALWSVPPALLLGLADALLNYALMNLLVGAYLGTIFLVNHIGTRVIEPDESPSFFLQQLSVTRNLGASRLHDLFFGGLNNHIEHHLFPSMPTARLRSARRITREFCRRHGLVYNEMSWFAAAREVARHFKAMSAFVPRRSAPGGSVMNLPLAREPQPALAPNFTVIVIGAGITGIGAGYYLGANKIPYTILEGQDDLGGIWNTQRWHGARCDSDFIKYSFSFKPFLSPHCLQSREHIHQYLHSVAKDFSILDHIRFNTRVSKAVFSPEEQQWTVHTNKGILTARFLINGNGYFSETPYVPAFKDSDTFKGKILHTFELDADQTFLDKHVVLVGSGSTAIACAPPLSLVSRSLVLLQRSPSYIHEISNEAGPLFVLCQHLYRIGITFPVSCLRYWLQFRDDMIFVGFRKWPGIARWFFKHHWLGTVGKESVREHFSPRYNPWEQRICVAIGLKEQLLKKQLSIKTGDIDRFTESSIVLTNGEHVKCDVCVLATGFDLKFFNFELYVGDAKVAVERINFYKGIMMGGIPNYFHPVGVWHSAWTQRSETATRFAIKIMAYMNEHGLGTVRIDRREVESSPSITPNYIKRRLPNLPRMYGTYDLPSIDNIVSYRFDPDCFKFS